MTGMATMATLLVAALATNSAKHANALKVIGAGLGRTGTDSLRLALNELGYGPTYHMLEVLGVPGRSIGDAYNRNHVDEWLRAAESDLRPGGFDWDEHFGMYRSGVDLPVQLFVEELAQSYPDAKVILTVRDPKVWHGSIREAWCRFTKGGMDDLTDQLFYDFRQTAYFSLFSTFERRFRKMTAAFDERMRRELAAARSVDGTKSLFGDQFNDFTTGRICQDEAYAIKFFDAWTTYVTTCIPRDRLLVLHTGQPGNGRELGEFLGVPEEIITNFTYPRSNSGEEFASGPIFFTRLEAVLSIICPLVFLLTILLCVRGRRRPRGRAKAD